MLYRATQRYADMTARKIRPFATLVRGKTLDEALQQLRFVPNRGARLLEKVLLSARGNALDKGARDVEDLVVHECCVDDGPTFKRIRPRARGTAYMILRRLAHIRVALADDAEFEGGEVSLPPGQTGQPTAPAGGAPAHEPALGAPAQPATSPAPEITGGTPADASPAAPTNQG